MAKLRVGVVGLGVMGRLYAQILDRHRDVTLVGLASRTMENAVQVASWYQHAIPYASGEELINSPGIDAVCIATPDHIHAELMVRAARAGLHIACEKPMTTSTSEAGAISEAVAASGVIAMVLYNHRWIPSYVQAKEAIASGAIGQPQMISARKNDRIFVPTEMLSWAESSSPAWFLSSHDLDLACWFLEDHIVSVSANGVRGVLDSMGINTFDGVHIQARFASEAIGQFESCWIQPNRFPTMVDSYLQIIGTDGVIQLDRQSEQIRVTTHDDHSYPRNLINLDVHGVATGAAAACVSHWVESMRQGSQPVVDLASSSHVTEVLEAAHRAIETAGVVAVGSEP